MSTSLIMMSIVMQIKIAMAIVFGDWRTALLARQLAVLPRAQLMLSDVQPHEVMTTLSWAQMAPLWLKIAQAYNAHISMACYSTQVRDVQAKDDYVSDLVQDIYMLPIADQYLVWNEQHRSDLLKAGVAEHSIKIVGPIIFSKTYDRTTKGQANDIIKIDYFDQTPSSRADLLFLGKPRMFFSNMRSIAALDMVVEAAKRAFPDRPYEIRLKAKRARGPQYLGPYSNRIEELSNALKDPILKIVKPETSPLYLHSTASLTVCFPFVSNAISSQTSGVPACFCNPGGDVMIEEGQAHGLPVITTVKTLAQWMKISLQIDDRTNIAS